MFQRAWLLAFENPYIEKIVLKKSARVGYAIFINSAVGWIIDNDPGNIMISQNTETEAEKFAVGEVGKLFQFCGRVSKRLFGKNTTKAKNFLGGVLNIVWATSGSSFRLLTVRYLFMDEISGYPDNVDNEGCPIELGITRTETESQRKIVLGSTPKADGTCKISREFRRTDQRYFYVPCPHCGHYHRMKLENFRYDPADFKLAHFVCPGCGKSIREHHKYAMVQQGQWRATREFTCCGTHQVPEQWDETGSALCCHCGKPGDLNERGKVDAGFHIWTAYNDNPNTSFPSLAAEYDEAKKEPLKMQAFMNTKVGVEYSEAGRAYKIQPFEKLYSRRELYFQTDILPDEILCVLGSVDTQPSRFEYHFWAVGKLGEIWALAYGAIHGDTESETTQKLLIDKLSEPFQLSDGRFLAAYAVVMDCNGHAWKAMLEFVMPYTGWIYAIRGDAHGQHKFSQDLTLTYSKHKEVGCEFRSINVHQLKNRAAERLNLISPGKNYVHFPVSDVFDLTYFRMLTAEHIVGSGTSVKWEKKPGEKRNEPWDLLVYVIWLYEFLRPSLRLVEPSAPLGLIQNTSSEQYVDESYNDSDGYDVSDYEYY